MSATRSFVSFFAPSLFVVACGGAPAPAPPPAPAAEPAAPAPAAPTAEAPKPAPPEATAPPAPAAKTSAIQIDGVSISEITADQLVAALKKRGWDSQALPESHTGKYEQVGVGARKDKTNKEMFNLAIARVAKKPTPITDATSEADFAPEKLQALYAKNEKVAQKYDAEAGALVSIMFLKGGSAAAAKTLLDGILVAAK